MRNILQTSFFVLTSVVAAAAAWAGDADLVARKTLEAPAIDGVADAMWEKAKPVVIRIEELTYKPSTGYDSIKSADVEVRAMYDAENIYVLARYKDPTESIGRFPWVKQPDGSWKRMSNKDSTGHENHYYEDKFSIFWHISEKGFPKKGCEQSCHTADNGKIDGIQDSSAGRHYTAAPGETTDMWHWKGTRTNPAGQADDQYVNWFKGHENKEWGRMSDVKSGGGYYDNVNEAKTAPAWMPPQLAATGVTGIVDAEKLAFVDTFKTATVISGMVSAPFHGPRGEIAAKGVWKDGMWTIEFKRKLVTVSEKAREEDVQFDDMKKTYFFGLAVFDNAQINHLYHKKPLKLGFEQ